MKTPTRTHSLMMLLTIALASTPTLAATIFVRANAAPGGNGATWATAYNNLRLALNAAVSGDEVWIARGTYTPDTLLDRGVRFTIKSGVKVYGGFAGTETAINQRPADSDPAAADPAFDTIISGEIGGPGPEDNTTVVVDFTGPGTGTLLDRAVVTRGTNTSGFGGGAKATSSSPTIRNVLFIDNRAGEGGGMVIDWNAAPLLEDCVFKANTASAGAGLGIRVSANPTIRRTSFIDNGGGQGGAIQMVFSSRATIESCTFSGNGVGTTTAGAIGVFITSQLTVRDSLFTSNVNGTINTNNSTVLLERTTFRGNSGRQGGAIESQASSNVTVRYCIFENNSGQFGGCIYSASPFLTVEDSTFTNNTGESGGVILANSPGSFTRCVFRGNTSLTGPARYGGVGYLWAGGSFTDCLFDGNRASLGGALYLAGGTTTIERATMINHSSTGSGGVFMQAETSTLTVRNSLIARNTSSIFASVLLASAGSSSFVNCTIADNSGASNALYVNPNASVTASNSILRNTGTEIDGPGTRSASFSNIEGGFAGAGNINAAPVYVDALAMNYRLASGSPGIDAGNNALVALNTTADLEGNNRFRDDPATSDTGVGTAPIVDIGAYEFQPLAPPPCIGDADGNRVVNFTDLTTVLANFGAAGAPFAPGDADGSGAVNFTDITTVLANFGAACP